MRKQEKSVELTCFSMLSGWFKFFCVHQMLMKDSMYQIDLGVIVRLITAILKKYWECVLQYLADGKEGLVAQKLEQRFRAVLERSTGRDGQNYMYYQIQKYVQYVEYFIF